MPRISCRFKRSINHSLSVFLMLVGISMGIASVSMPKAEARPQGCNSFGPEQKPFIVHYLVSRSTDGGPPDPYEYRVKYVNSSGEWKETRYSFDGKIVTWVASKDGLYIAKKDSLQYYGKHDADMVKYPNASREAITASPQFTRIEQIAGLEAYILKNSGADTETETAFSVETGRIPLRIASKLKRGDTQLVNLIEAISVEFKQIPEDEFQLPNLPIRFDVAEQKAQSLKQAGQTELATQLERTISALKARIK